MFGDLLISPLCCYLGYTLPPIGRPPQLRDFNCWSGFFPSLALLYEPSGLGECKGLYALTGPLPVYTCGTQHQDATQHIHNYTCNRTVYILHTKIVTFVGKLYWFQLMNNWTFILCIPGCPWLDTPWTLRHHPFCSSWESRAGCVLAARISLWPFRLGVQSQMCPGH